ncbi:ABC transporter G member 12 [Irineochytrium annulatum]|nr:ABC transporter G member 12 [Irineochytrium annulatum]
MTAEKKDAVVAAVEEKKDVEAMVVSAADYEAEVSAAPAKGTDEVEAQPKAAPGAGDDAEKGSVQHYKEDKLDPPTPTYYSFHVKSASMKVKNEDKVLLTEVSGYCKPGESLAIMGPSGAGKSTLLDILAYRKTLGKWDADTHVNGIPTNRNTFIATSGYVCSDDLLSEELTCIETLRFYASLRLPSHFTHEQKEERIKFVMDKMHLNNCAKTRVGSIMSRGLSTGERKRLNIAVELLPVKTVLFLDEPTTGLDSTTGREIISNILEAGRQRQLAVVATIHQPSYTILRQFDRLLLLTAGKVAYFGPTADAIAFFESQGVDMDGNPAEVYAERLAASPEESIKFYSGSDLAALNAKKVQQIHSGAGSIVEPAAKVDKDGKPLRDDNSSGAMAQAGFFQITPAHNQIWQVIKRQLVIYSRNLLMSTGRFAAAIVVGLFFGWGFYNLQDNQAAYDAKSAMAFAISQISPLFCVAAISYWIAVRKQYNHEVASGMYHPLFYHIASFLIEVVFLDIIMLILLGIFLPLSNWHSEHFGFYIGLALMENFAIVGFSQLCAHISSTIPYANVAFTAVYYNAILFNGYYVTDAFAQPHCGVFCSHFWQWTSYMRLFIKPALRTEMTGYKLTCLPSELLPINLSDLTKNAMDAATEKLTVGFKPTDPTPLAGGFIAANKTLMGLSTSNPDAFNATVTAILGVYSPLGLLQNSALALKTLGVFAAKSPALTQTLNVSTVETLTALQAALNLTTLNVNTGAVAVDASGKPTNPVEAGAWAALGMVGTTSGLSTNIKAFGLPDLSTCSYSNGSDYLVKALGYVESDSYANTPDSLYYGIDILQTVVTFVLSYMALVFIKYQKK